MVNQKAERIKISFAFRQHLIIAACYVSKMYKRTAVGLYGKPYNTKPVGGASCPAEQHQVQVKPNTSSAWYWKPLPTFSMVNQKAERIKISFAFRQHLIIAACYVSKMYGWVVRKAVQYQTRRRGILPRRATPSSSQTQHVICMVLETATDFFNGQPKRPDG